MLNPILLISFRRSGAHFLLETLKNNFNYPLVDNSFHPGFDLHHAAQIRHDYTPMYIYRNPIDVMKSLYNFFKYSDWRIWSGFDVDMSNLSFSEFLHGKTRIINVFCPHFKLIFENPILAWVEHTKWMIPLNKHDVKGSIFSVKYENLVDQPEKEILRISKNINIRLRNDRPVPYRNIVARTKKNDVVEFTTEDEDLLLKVAGNKMKELGYL